MPYRKLIGPIGCVVFLALNTSVAQAGPPPSLAGTWLQAQGSPSSNQVTGQCDVAGTTLRDSWSGTITAGPYSPGTYTETATATVGPTGQAGLYFGTTGYLGLPNRAVQQMSSHVVVTSGSTTIDLSQEPDSARPESGGICSAVSNYTDPNLIYWYDLADHQFQTFTLWTATITTPTGRFQETGKGWISSIFSDGHYDLVLPDGSHTVSGSGSTGNFVNLYTGSGPAPLGPAHVALTPPDATAPVGTGHTVTAIVTDAAGGALSGSIVLFSVTGADTTRGSCTTDQTGSCSYTYTGPDLPGADEITACADANTNGVVDSGEPCSTATQAWLLPTATAGHVTGGGQIPNATSTDQIAFGFNAQSDGTSFKGEGTLVDPSANVKLKLTDAKDIVQVGSQATIFGDAIVNGTATTYRLDVVDNGEPGRNRDTFRLHTASGYLASGTLSGGNIQSH